MVVGNCFTTLTPPLQNLGCALFEIVAQRGLIIFGDLTGRNQGRSQHAFGFHFQNPSPPSLWAF